MLTCSSSSGALFAGQPADITCTLTASGTPSWSAVSTPAGAVFDFQTLTAAGGTLHATFRAADLPPLTPDGNVTVTVTASLCGGLSASSPVTLSLIGNTLFTDQVASQVKIFGSDGTQVGTLVGPLSVTDPTLVHPLPDGNFLVGQTYNSTAAGSPLQEIDANGNLVAAWQATNGTGTQLFYQLDPFDAAEDGQGNEWVSAIGPTDQAGALYVFDLASRSWTRTVKVTIPGSQPFQPLALAYDGQGHMVASLGTSGSEIAVISTSSFTGSAEPLTFKTCSDASGPTVCSSTSQDYSTGGLLFESQGLLVAATGDEAAELALFSWPALGFNTATLQPANSAFTSASVGRINAFGPYLLVGDPTGDCPNLVDPSTLYLLNNSCFVSGSQGEHEYVGFAHLTQ